MDSIFNVILLEGEVLFKAGKQFYLTYEKKAAIHAYSSHIDIMDQTCYYTFITKDVAHICTHSHTYIHVCTHTNMHLPTFCLSHYIEHDVIQIDRFLRLREDTDNITFVFILRNLSFTEFNHLPQIAQLVCGKAEMLFQYNCLHIEDLKYFFYFFSIIFPLTTPKLMAEFENALWHMKHDALSEKSF